MAFLDVTDIVLDPDFCDTGLVQERQTQTISSGGMASAVTVQTTFAGVVCSADGTRLERRAQGDIVPGSITIHTPLVLSTGKAGGIMADVVQWSGARYTVVRVNSYSHFGAGFVAAECDLIPVAGD